VNAVDLAVEGGPLALFLSGKGAVLFRGQVEKCLGFVPGIHTTVTESLGYFGSHDLLLESEWVNTPPGSKVHAVRRLHWPRMQFLVNIKIRTSAREIRIFIAGELPDPFSPGRGTDRTSGSEAGRSCRGASGDQALPVPLRRWLRHGRQRSPPR